MTFFIPKIIVELLRLEIFFNRGSYDISSLFQQSVNDRNNNRSSSDLEGNLVKRKMLQATISLGIELRLLDAALVDNMLDLPYEGSNDQFNHTYAASLRDNIFEFRSRLKAGQN